MSPDVHDFERPAEAGDRTGHVVDGLRRSVLPYDVCGQADGGPQPKAVDRAGEINIERLTSNVEVKR
jgi:hypothetical protein